MSLALLAGDGKGLDEREVNCSHVFVLGIDAFIYFPLFLDPSGGALLLRLRSIAAWS